MGIPCSVVLSFNSATARKQRHSLARGIEKLKREILVKWDGYKKRPKVLPQGIQSLLKDSDYGTCLSVSVEDGELTITPNDAEIAARSEAFR